MRDFEKKTNWLKEAALHLDGQLEMFPEPIESLEALLPGKVVVSPPGLHMGARPQDEVMAALRPET